MPSSLGLRSSIGGQRVLAPMRRPARPARHTAAQGAAVTQRLKPGKAAGTQRLKQPAPDLRLGGTQVKKKVRVGPGVCTRRARAGARPDAQLPCLQLSSIGLFGSGKEGLRQRKDAQSAPRLLTRLEQLRLLSKAVRP
jgi:hypothetical protein